MMMPVSAPLIKDPVWLSCTQLDSTSQIWVGQIPPDLVYFEGHFEHFPLVPGVVELQWAVEKAMQFFSCPKPILRIDNLKFQKFVRPNDQFSLTLKWDHIKNRMTFQFKIDEEMCGSGGIIFENEAPEDHH